MTAPDPVPAALEAALADARANTAGALADYIPELAKANPDEVGLALVGVGGRTYEVGDTSATFTIQSVSKPFVYALANNAGIRFARGGDGVLGLYVNMVGTGSGGATAVASWIVRDNPITGLTLTHQFLGRGIV